MTDDRIDAILREAMVHPQVLVTESEADELIELAPVMGFEAFRVPDNRKRYASTGKRAQFQALRAQFDAMGEQIRKEKSRKPRKKNVRIMIGFKHG